MSRVLLADDSPHAQRMGERILRDEGYEVVSVTDGNTALLRLNDVDPDVILADAFLPSKSGFDLCRFVRSTPRYQHVRVVLVAGLLETVDENEAREIGADAILRKPFEASAMLDTIRPLIESAQAGRDPLQRANAAVEAAPAEVAPVGTGAAPSAATAEAEVQAAVAIAPPVVEPERVRAAVTLALDAAMPALVDEITEKVLIALRH